MKDFGEENMWKKIKNAFWNVVCAPLKREVLICAQTVEGLLSVNDTIDFQNRFFIW